MVTLLASSLLLKSLKAEAFPVYGFETGKPYTYKVKAKNSLQPYSVGGTLTLTLKAGKSTELRMLELSHATELEAGGQKETGPVQTSIWEVTPLLRPTASGEGANLFGEQLMLLLAAPSAATESLQFLGSNLPQESKVSTDGKTIKVESTAKFLVSTHQITRILDAKSKVLLQGKCETTSAVGTTTYELLPQK